MNKIVFIAIFTLQFFDLKSQINDSILKSFKVDSVVVLGTKAIIISDAGNFDLYDFDNTKNQSFNTLEKLLETNSKISIKKYGEGQLSTVSVKGFNASHTDIKWNGVKINSPKLGQADASMLTLGNYTNLSFSEFFSDNIAGEIEVKNRINYKKKNTLKLTSSLSSIANFTQGISYEFSKKKKFYSNSNISISYNLNRYKYFNKSILSRNEIYLKNGETKAVHFEQINAFKLQKGNQLKLFLKTTFSDRNIAPTIYEFSSSKNQKDHLVLGKIVWSKIHKKYNFLLDAAFVNQQMNYKLSKNSSVIVNSSNSIQTNFFYKLKTHKKLTFLLRINNDIQNGKSNNYNNTIWQNKLSVKPFLEYKINNSLSTIISVSEILLNTKFSQPLPSISIKYLPRKQPANILLQFDYKRKVKFPSLNDFYWNPGGNIDLKEEYAHSLNAVFVVNKRINKIKFNNKFEWFNIFSENYIQWQPSRNGYWQPNNIGNIYSRGFTNNFDIEYKFNKRTKLSNNLSFNYTRTTKKNQYEQLIYVPINNWNNSTKFETKYFKLLINQQFVSNKYTNYKNTLSLDNYYLLDLIIAKEFWYKFQVSIEANNVLNQTYFTYINRALPKRNYAIKLKYNFAI